MRFADAMRKEENWTTTENGAVALKSTGNSCVDFFETVGALREADPARKRALFDEAYNEDKLTAIKILFYGRDVRFGAGERQTFKDIISYAADIHPEAVKNNIKLFGEYGRWDDIYCLVGTSLEREMWKVVKEQLSRDLKNHYNRKYHDISLLAKWLKTADASSENTRKLGIYTAQRLGYSVIDYKHILKALRKDLKIVERDMSANRWSKIDYSAVPSRAMTLYRNAFERHDEDRFSKFINKAITGEAKINSSTLYPYDIVEKFLPTNWGWEYVERPKLSANDKKVLEAQWRQLPNYVEPGTNAVVVADTSGSMMGRPLATSVGLAIYFAQHNTGAYHGLWMNFSDNPHYNKVKGNTLETILSNINYDDWGNSTNCKAVFDLILDTAIKNHVSEDEMCKSIIIVSDMEFNYCGNQRWTFYDSMRAKFARYGYCIPNIIFWNVNSRSDVHHVDSSKKGVQLLSGQSASTFKYLASIVGKTPYEAMREIIDGERYSPITIA